LRGGDYAISGKLRTKAAYALVGALGSDISRPVMLIKVSEAD
jgi:hypothetical protein